MQKLINVFTIFSLIFIGSATIASAQEGMPAGVETETREFTDAQKEAFVSAYLKVNEIQQQYRTQLDPEMSEEQMQEVANKANQQIETAIDAQDNMDTDTYRQILMAIETDQELLNEIQTRLENM